ncbi:MAG: hypothetical protein SWH61_01135 [Thermodesulfobacteriota bacterium]|nr:hypothetical protein [Thermodesulfobacteriota bacterium]
MSVFMKSMAIFWLFAEGLIMVLVRKGLLYIETGRSRQHSYLLFCVCVFITVTALTFGRDLIAGRLLGMADTVFYSIYDGSMWNLICTMWVIIEGAVAVYILRIYILLKTVLNNQLPGKSSGRFRVVTLFGPAVACGALLAGFVFYHFAFHAYLCQHGGTFSVVDNALKFYIKICGIFWILIEWAVALIAIQIFLLLKRNLKRGAA